MYASLPPFLPPFLFLFFFPPRFPLRPPQLFAAAAAAAGAAVGGEVGLSAVSPDYPSSASHFLHVSLRLHLGTFSKSTFVAWAATSHEMHLSANFHSALEINDAGFGAHAAPQDGPLKVR